jgi:hypothetical protein
VEKLHFTESVHCDDVTPANAPNVGSSFPRSIFPAGRGAENDEDIEIFRCAKGVHHQAGRERHAVCRGLSEGGDQPSEVLQLEEALRRHDVWAMDFVHDQLATGRNIRALTVVDTFSHYVSALDPRFSERGEDVVATLERV